MSVGKPGLPARRSPVRYARVGEVNLAHRVVACSSGETRDIVLVLAGTMPMDALFDDRVGVRLLEGLSDLGRLIMFDRRGIGLSDPPIDWDEPAFTAWVEDIEAVVGASEASQPIIVSGGVGAVASLAYVLRYADGVASLVLLEPSPLTRIDPDVVRAQIEGEIDSVAMMCPSRADEPGFREWFTRAGHAGASPRLAARAYALPTEEQVHEIQCAAAETQIPVLILRRPAAAYSPTASEDPFVKLVPGARRVEIPGTDRAAYGGEVDVLLAEISRFVTGEYRAPVPERTLAAVMYTDLVSSTERTASVGDAHWKQLVNHHDDAAQACVGRRGGKIVKTTGDGVLATFSSATNAIHAAEELHARLAELDLHARIGIHVGEIDARADDISGIAVTIAARVMDKAAPGETLLSETVQLAIAGSDIELRGRGAHRLKGIDRVWTLYEAAGSAARSSPPDR